MTLLCICSDACSFLQPIYYDIDIAATHNITPGVANCTADHLSRNNMSQFFLLNPQVNQKPTSLPQLLIKIMTTPGMDCMDISSLHRAVQHYYINGLAPSTHRSYKAGQSQYLAFCRQIQCSAIPTSESTMLLFVAYLAKDSPTLQLKYTWQPSIIFTLQLACAIHIRNSWHPS